MSLLIPSCSPIRRHAAVMLPASSAMSATRRIARSRISSGYFFGAGMTPPFRGFGVSINPGAIQCTGLVSQHRKENVSVSKGSGDRRRNARLAELRLLVCRENAIVGIDLAEDNQAVVVT